MHIDTKQLQIYDIFLNIMKWKCNFFHFQNKVETFLFSIEKFCQCEKVKDDEFIKLKVGKLTKV